jgi:hypothetical protein
VKWCDGEKRTVVLAIDNEDIDRFDDDSSIHLFIHS